MDTVFTLQDLLVFFLICFAAAACVYLIIIFRNLNKFFVNMNSITNENRDDIRTTIARLPDMTRNVNSVASGINDSVGKVNSVAGSIEDVIVDTVAASNGGMDKTLTILSMASGTANAISKTFNSKKKPGLLKAMRG